MHLDHVHKITKSSILRDLQTKRMRRIEPRWTLARSALTSLAGRPTSHGSEAYITREKGKNMNSTTKLLLGGLATAALAWVLHGPLHFGERCAAGAATVTAPVTETTTPAVGAPEVAATSAAVTSCQTAVNDTIKGKTINFASGGATIAVDSAPLIDAVAKALKDCAGTTIEVGGHTDVTGGDAANQRLSEKRANSVVEALVDKGIPATRLTPKGFGETSPLDTTATAAANAVNRRIEFTVATTAAGAAAPSGQ